MTDTSASIELAAKMAAVDFEVSLLGRTETSALLWAIRKGASGIAGGISTVGVWHFIEVSEAAGGSTISQWHIPRFKLADDLATLKRVPKTFGAASVLPAVFEVARGLSLVMVAPGVIHFAAEGHGTLPMCSPVEELLRKDLTTLKRARAEVREMAVDDYDLPDAETPNGGPVRSSSEDLIAAVAFEWLTTGGLFATDFGIYSAHCTCSDFTTTERMGDDLIMGLSSKDLGNDAAESRSTVREWYAETERRLFRMPVWSQFTQTAADERRAALAEAMASLTRTQRVQFALMNGMLQAGVMMPLATVTRIITFEQYLDARCEGLQPDDAQEQEVRKVVSFIRLYGQLAGANPVPKGFTVTESACGGSPTPPPANGMKRAPVIAKPRQKGQSQV